MVETKRSGADGAPEVLDALGRTPKGRSMRVLDEYFEALRDRNWERLASCLAEDVCRTGPYLDVHRGRRAYVKFLSHVIPTLQNYEIKVLRVRELDTSSALVELIEVADVGGVPTEFPEVILFDFDEAGSILRVDIYIKQPGRTPARPGRDIV